MCSLYAQLLLCPKPDSNQHVHRWTQTLKDCAATISPLGQIKGILGEAHNKFVLELWGAGEAKSVTLYCWMATITLFTKGTLFSWINVSVV
jgi:hypothetical protein